MKLTSVVLVPSSLAVSSMVFGVMCTTVSPSDAASLHQQRTTYQAPAKITRVTVSDEIGKVVVKTGARHQVTTTAQWSQKKPTVQVTTSHGVVSVKATCPSSGLVDGVVVGDNDCSVDVTVVVAATSAVKVSTDVGDVTARGMSGTEDLTSSTGDVSAVRATGSSISTRSDVGDVAVSVPRGAYAFRTHTDDGSVSVSGVTYRASARTTITATSSDGDVTLAGY